MRDLIVASGSAVHVSRGTHASDHALHAFKLVVPIDAPLVLGAHGQRPRTIAAPLLVAPNVSQSIGCEGDALALFWAPERDDARGLLRLCDGSALATILGGRQAQWLVSCARTVRDELSAADAGPTLLSEVARKLAPGASTLPPLDGRVRDAQDMLWTVEDTRLDRDALSRELGLSASRLSHLFRGQTGTTLQRYALWVRTMRAVESLLTGSPIAMAAVEAGFSDHAHFGRAMRRFFGQPPSYVKALDSRIVQAWRAPLTHP